MARSSQDKGNRAKMVILFMGAGFILRFFCRIAGGFEGKSGVFLQSYSATKFGLHFCFLRSFFILPRRYFLRGGVWLNFFCRFFCGDFEVSRGEASRNFLTPVRPCEHEKGVADNESGGFLSGAIFIAFVHAVRRVAELFFPLSPKKRKIFIFGAKLKILP